MNKQEIKFNIQKHKAKNKANYKETIIFSIASHKGLCTLRKEKHSLISNYIPYSHNHNQLITMLSYYQTNTTNKIYLSYIEIS